MSTSRILLLLPVAALLAGWGCGTPPPKVTVHAVAMPLPPPPEPMEAPVVPPPPTKPDPISAAADKLSAGRDYHGTPTPPPVEVQAAPQEPSASPAPPVDSQLQQRLAALEQAEQQRLSNERSRQRSADNAAWIAERRRQSDAEMRASALGGGNGGYINTSPGYGNGGGAYSVGGGANGSIGISPAEMAGHRHP